jgi:kynureninase
MTTLSHPATGHVTRATLAALDQDDPLARFRDLFSLPEGVVYLDGNSLGALPRDTPQRVASVVAREWGNGLIRSWNDAGWIDAPARIGDKIGNLIGAAPGTVMVADSTSVNLFKLLGAALHLRPGRRVILSERGNFPTDLYIAQGLAALLGDGHTLRLAERDRMADSIDDDTAVVMLTHVNYHHGAMYDMAAITRAVHAKGALMLWDLCHSAGAVPVDLGAADADFAVGCGYKFLNGGPGAPAFLHVARRLQDQLRFPITGWLGHAAPFAFETDFRPASGIAGAVVGTPPMISMAALEAGIDIAVQAPMEQLRAKSIRQAGIFADLVAQHCAGHGLVLASPADPAQGGSQVCFAHPEAWPIMQALIARGVIGDFRAPDILRFGLTPLYLGYADLWDAVQVLRQVLDSGEWRQDRFRQRRKVT